MSQTELTLFEAPKPTGPTVKRGRSKQDYATPPEFIAAVERRFGLIAWDLAADGENAVNRLRIPAAHFTEAQNALAQPWLALGGTLWLNPPFDDIAPWAAKCASVRDRAGWTLLLVPASIGTDWFSAYVDGKAFVLGLSPRMSFDGVSPYPKDLMLCCFGFGLAGFGTWRWKP